MTMYYKDENTQEKIEILQTKIKKLEDEQIYLFNNKKKLMTTMDSRKINKMINKTIPRKIKRYRERINKYTRG